MQAHLTRLLTVGDIETKGPDWRTHAGADTVTDDETRCRDLVECVAGIDESCDAPRLIDPARRLDAADDIVASGDGCFPVFHAETLISVAAHRRIAAGAKQQRRRYFLPRCAEYTASLQTRRE